MCVVLFTSAQRIGGLSGNLSRAVLGEPLQDGSLDGLNNGIRELQEEIASLKSRAQQGCLPAKKKHEAPDLHAGGKRSAVERALATIPPDGADPPPSTSIVAEFGDVCLRADRGTDRYSNPEPRKSVTAAGRGWGMFEKQGAFVIQDLCKMGHQPKDAMLLHAFIEEHRQQGGALPMVLFGNRCMTRSTRQAKGAWHVLRHWFDVAQTASQTMYNGSKSKIVHIEDFQQGVCLGKYFRRPHNEPFRWMRTNLQADTFRRDFLEHFGVAEQSRKVPRVTVVRRGIERHFNEDEAYAKVRSGCGTRCDVKYVQFDGDANPQGVGVDAERVTGYKEQLQVLASTDVLIAAHGAALSSLVALPKGSAVLELFPHNFRYHMYAELAHLFSIMYFPLESLMPHHNGRDYCKSCGYNNFTAVTRPYHANGRKQCLKCTPPCKRCDIKFEYDDQWVPAVCFFSSKFVSVNNTRMPTAPFRVVQRRARRAWKFLSCNSQGREAKHTAANR